MPDLPPAAQHAADVCRDAIQAQAEATFGGRDRLDVALGWAAGNLDAADRDRINAALASDPASAATAIHDLKRRHAGAQRARADADLRAAGVPSTAEKYRAVRSRALRGDVAARKALRAISPGQLSRLIL